MNPHDRQIKHSSKSACWRTPPELFDALHTEFAFVADAAADATNHLCKDWLGPGAREGFEDALGMAWPLVGYDGGGGQLQHQVAYFLNPPYSVEERNRLTQLGAPKMAASYDIENWAQKCWQEAQRGCTIVGVFPHSVQTQWYRSYVRGLTDDGFWNGFAADQVREIPHRVSFPTAGGESSHNAPGNSCIIIWRPNHGWVGPWTPTVRCWDYRK